MPDISMCLRPINCSQQNSCYRFTAKPSLYQSYCDFQPIDNKCDYFWDNKLN